MSLRLRAMTEAEYDEWCVHLARDFAEEVVTAGTWPAEGAVERALAEHHEMLPQGSATPGMLVFKAEDDEGVVGNLWVGLAHPRGAPDTGWVYDIEVFEHRRGQGLGRELLRAAEEEVARHGVGHLALNVFGGNAVAISLYASSGYETVSMQMRKRVRP